MMPGLKPYPRMKDSGEVVLGVVPEHWDVNRLGQLGGFSKGNGGNKEDAKESGVPCVRYGDLYTSHNFFIETSRSYVSPERANDYTPIQFGDVLFAGSGETIDEIGKSAVNLIRADACCGGDVILFRSNREVSDRFMGYATDCAPTAIQKARMGRGITVMHIYAAELKNLIVALPPLPEQTAIARFLDHMDRRIQKYIRAKEKLIALLDEYKQALIHQAVTGQIDVRTGEAYPEYKESGVEWVGRIPRHWNVRRVRTVAEMRVSNVDKHTKEGESPVRLCNYVDVYHHDHIHPGMTLMKASATQEEIQRFRLERGDVLITKDSEVWNDIAVPALVEGGAPDILSGYHLAILRPHIDMVDGGYLFRALQSQGVAAQLHVRANGVTRYGLSHNAIKSATLPLPSIPEQSGIARFLDRVSELVSQAISSTNSQIRCVAEHRARLIADVVTGKLDVREAAASLPDLDPINVDSSNNPLNQIDSFGLDETTAVA